MKFFSKFAGIALRYGILVFIFIIIGCSSEINLVPEKNEIVLETGDKVIANNENGTIVIEAGEGLERFYYWEGEKRSVIMIPRSKRWNGSFGLYYPGDGNHWKEHNRITRGVIEEGQQKFKTSEQAIDWLNQFDDIVYNDHGLAVRYSKSIKPDPGPGSTLFVSVWQIYINDSKPTKLPRSSNQSIKLIKAHSTKD